MENAPKIGLKLISLVFCFRFVCFFLDIYLIDFRMVASPRYEFPSPSDHAPQSAERYAALKIHNHLEGREMVINISSFFSFRSEIIFVHARLN